MIKNIIPATNHDPSDAIVASTGNANTTTGDVVFYDVRW